MALRDITLGQYFPGESPIHRLDPRAKLVAMTCYIVALFLGRRLVTYGILLLALAAVFALDRYVLESPQKMWKGLLTVICVGMVALYTYRMVTMFPHTEPMTYYEGNLLRRAYGWGQAIRAGKNISPPCL